MNARLATVAPGLAEDLEQSHEAGLRRVARRVAVDAIARADLRDPAAQSALADLRKSNFGETPARAQIKELTDSLDERAWDMQDRVESGGAEEEEYIAAFQRARAAMAVYFALDADPLVAAIEATYEACIAFGESEVRELVAGVS